MSEEKAQRAMIDAARLADELRMEQDVAGQLERERKVTEAQVKDANTRCVEAEMNTLMGGKTAIKSCIRELDSDMEAESRSLATLRRT